MNKLRGPEIKLPEIKVPRFLSDLIGDLRDRHLLPLVGLLLVAIVAVPFALKSSDSTSPSVAGQTGLAANGTANSAPDAVTFADSATGLRDYRRRLRNLRAKDPFKQQYATPAAGGSVPGTAAPPPSTPAAVASTGSSLPSSAAPAPGGGSGGASAGNGGGGETSVKVETKYASYEIDVRITGAGSGAGNGGTASSKSAAKVRRGLPELTMLPSRQTPAAVFMGVSSDSKKALLLISSDVRSVFGDARCLVGSQTCQLLALEPGLPETFIYGGRGRAFRIEVLKIKRVLSRHPHRASLGG